MRPPTRVSGHPDPTDLELGCQAGSSCEVHHEVKPLEIIGFVAHPGDGCESLVLGLARYPETITFWDACYSRRSRQREVRTHLDSRWRWSAFCKTQYASQHGVAHFVRCHLLVVAVLDQARQLGMLQRVSDEADYWRQRRLDLLAREVQGHDAFIAAMHKVLQAAVPSDLAVASPIEKYPDYSDFILDKLAAEFPELHAAVVRTARAMQRCRVLVQPL